MNDKTIRSMKLYLDDVYNDLECIILPNEVTWYKNEKPVAGLTRSNPYRLKLSSSEFYSFIKTFCLPWEKEEDNIILLMMIIPYLKFNGGSPAIPVLLDMGFIENLTQIGLPSYWN